LNEINAVENEIGAMENEKSNEIPAIGNETRFVWAVDTNEEEMKFFMAE